MYKPVFFRSLVVLVLVFSMTTPSSEAQAQPKPQTSPTLGVADSFSVLAETNITNIPTSVIGQDVGLSPSTGASNALTDPEVGGIIYSTDGFGPAGSTVDPALLTQAINDMMAAFTAIDQPCTTTYAGVQDLTTVSPLGPGVYCAGAFLLTGNLTLAGSGVWIFKSAATLTTGVGSSVTGGDPCNVWWRLVSAADIFTGSSMVGNVLAGTSINMQAGASLNGRALAQAAVTLNSNTISGPACTVGGGLGGGAGAGSSSSSGDEDEDGADSEAFGVLGLPDTGGSVPIRNESLGSRTIVAIGFSALVLSLGVWAYRNKLTKRKS
jgi:hypothetical protein